MDEVAVVGHPVTDTIDGRYWPDDATPILRVATGTGVLTYRVRLAGPVFGHVVLGAAQVDGVGGDELLVGYADGAHGHPATMVTDHDGALMALPAPDPYSGVKGDVLGSWGSDGSIMSDLGWQCLPGGRVEEFAASGEREARNGRIPYTLEHQAWRWTARGWVPVGSRVIRRHAPVAAITETYSGWHGCGSFVAERPYR